METAEYLITVGGADVNHEDNKHETPMIIAKRTGKKPIINLLLQHGAKNLDDLRKGALAGRNGKKLVPELPQSNKPQNKSPSLDVIP